MGVGVRAPRRQALRRKLPGPRPIKVLRPLPGSHCRAVLCRLALVARPQPRHVGERMHTFQIVTTGGRGLGPMALGRPDWPVGSVIYQGFPKPNLRVVERRKPEPSSAPVLVVEE